MPLFSTLRRHRESEGDERNNVMTDRRLNLVLTAEQVDSWRPGSTSRLRGKAARRRQMSLKRLPRLDPMSNDMSAPMSTEALG